MSPRVTPLGLVRIVGTGLIGASVGMALRAAGIQVALEDASPTAAALACDLGAGHTQVRALELDPDIVVVAVPPDVAARVVAAELQRWPGAVVTDVASVKGRILDQVRDVLTNDPVGVGHLARYVGSHPMAGRERSGAVAAQPDLFEGRPWVVTPHESSSPWAVAAVAALAAHVGAAVVRMTAEEHDAAVVGDVQPLVGVRGDGIRALDTRCQRFERGTRRDPKTDGPIDVQPCAAFGCMRKTSMSRCTTKAWGVKSSLCSRTASHSPSGIASSVLIVSCAITRKRSVGSTPAAWTSIAA